MRQAQLSLTVSIRATLVFLVAFSVGAIALLGLGTRPAETQETTAQPLYMVHELGTLGGSWSSAVDINDTDKVVGSSGTRRDAEVHAFLYSGGQISDLGTLGGTYSTATGINNADEVVGSSTTSGDAGNHAFLYSDRQMKDLGTLGGSSSEATGINDAGKVVGHSWLSNEVEEHAFLYSDGQMNDLGTLGGSRSFAHGINNADEVVGYSFLSGDTDWHAFLYSDGVMRDMGTLGGTYSNATGINDIGKVVGYAETRANDTHAFLYSDGTMSDIGTLGSYSVAFGINNADEVVGYSGTGGDAEDHAFLYSDGVMRDLNSLIPEDSSLVLNAAYAINDSDHIVGVGSYKGGDGQAQAFLLTPYFDGFYQPVDNLPTLNKSKPGKTIPIRFGLGANKGLDIFADGYPKSEAIPCDSTATVDGIEETVIGKGGLSYNASTDTYQYAWATSSSWSGCRQFVMKLKDGSVHRANFIFR